MLKHFFCCNLDIPTSCCRWPLVVDRTSFDRQYYIGHSAVSANCGNTNGFQCKQLQAPLSHTQSTQKEEDLLEQKKIGLSQPSPWLPHRSCILCSLRYISTAPCMFHLNVSTCCCRSPCLFWAPSTYAVLAWSSCLRLRMSTRIATVLSTVHLPCNFRKAMCAST